MTMYAVSLVLLYNVANLAYIAYKTRKEVKRRREEVLLYGPGGGSLGEKRG